MGYIESTLLPGERVVARARLHWIVFSKAILVLAVGLALFAVDARIAAVFIVLAVAMAMPPLVTSRSSEFAVTSKRVIVKVGVVRRRTLELLLPQVEAILVDQSIAGRLFNYGSLTLTGTGGVREVFDNIAAPLEFRRQIQGQTISSS